MVHIELQTLNHMVIHIVAADNPPTHVTSMTDEVAAVACCKDFFRPWKFIARATLNAAEEFDLQTRGLVSAAIGANFMLG
ncbi:hypothetical protein PT974_02876 [Cladobotryum mycophilum]|uniref:Uncharacterized protein n=1 Tax=Cladobotryum mycophilum TaxID=491253 RepID=A0ABR0SZA6_9HYPO